MNMTTSVKWRNTVLLSAAAVGLLYLYWILTDPCGWRRFHKLFEKTSNVPVFVTGGDFKTYQASKIFLQDLYRVHNSRYWGMEVIYVDLGLTGDQVLDLAELCLPCECVIKQIPKLTEILKSTDVDPGFTEAMVMRTIMDQHPFLMWIDSSTRLNSSTNLTELFEKTAKNGVQIAVGRGRIDDEFGLRSEHFKLLGENPIYYASKPSLDTSWMLVGELEPKIAYALEQYFVCVERSLCFRQNTGKMCQSNQKPFSVRQCQAILAVRLINEFDQCYRSFAFSVERYVVMESPTCIISAANGY